MAPTLGGCGGPTVATGHPSGAGLAGHHVRVEQRQGGADVAPLPKPIAVSTYHKEKAEAASLEEEAALLISCPLSIPM